MTRSRPRRVFSPPAACSFFFLAAALAASPSFAGTFVGPTDCTNCHDHDAATKAWHNHAHFKSLDIFEGPKAKAFTTKLKISDPYGEFCAKCHATMVDGEANFGVSCESCHGAASAFIKPHQKKGSYEEAIKLGMLRTKDLAVRARNCVGCHLVTDRRLLDVGHPTGANFDIVEGSKKVQHWQETATPDQILAAWKGAVAAAGGVPVASKPAAPGTSSQVPPPPPPAEAKTVAPAHGDTPTAPTPIQPAPAPVKPGEQRPPASPAAATIALPPDDAWPSDLPALDSVASLQARLILVLNKLLVESHASSAGGAIAAETPAASAASPEARLIDLQRRVLSLQRKLLTASGK